MKIKYWCGMLLLGSIFDIFFGGSSMSDFDRTLNGITSGTSRRIEKQYPYMESIAVGGSIDINHIIDYETLEFIVRKEITRDEAVILLAKIIDEYMYTLHAEKKMKEYLEKHSFTYKNLQIAFLMQDDRGDKRFHPALGTVRLFKGKVHYRTVRPSERYYYEDVLNESESFEEAAKRVGVWKE